MNHFFSEESWNSEIGSLKSEK